MASPGERVTVMLRVFAHPLLFAFTVSSGAAYVLLPVAGIATILYAVAVRPSELVALAWRYHVPLVCLVVTVALVVLLSILQPEAGTVRLLVHTYSSFAALVAVILPVSTPPVLVMSPILTVGAAAVPTVTSVLLSSVNLEFVPVSLHISLICEVQSSEFSLIELPARAGTVPVKYSTLVSAPPAYLKVPQFVVIVELLLKLLLALLALLALSTISSKISEIVTLSP